MYVETKVKKLSGIWRRKIIYNITFYLGLVRGAKYVLE